MYRAKNGDAIKAHKRLWRAQNLDDAKRRDRASYRRHRQARLQYARLYQSKSIEKNRTQRTGMTPGMFAARLSEQGNACSICDATVNSSSHADHCHATNRTRGVLCRKCNQGLGLFLDSPELLESAAKYLRKWEARWALS